MTKSPQKSRVVTGITSCAQDLSVAGGGEQKSKQCFGSCLKTNDGMSSIRGVSRAPIKQDFDEVFAEPCFISADREYRYDTAFPLSCTTGGF